MLYSADTQIGSNPESEPGVLLNPEQVVELGTTLFSQTQICIRNFKKWRVQVPATHFLDVTECGNPITSFYAQPNRLFWRQACIVYVNPILGVKISALGSHASVFQTCMGT